MNEFLSRLSMMEQIHVLDAIINTAPSVSQSDDFVDALYALHRTFNDSFDLLTAAATARTDEDEPEEDFRVCEALFGSYR